MNWCLNLRQDIYNTLTIHGLITCDKLPQSVLDVQLFWKTTAYHIGGHVFSLDDIEHGILRGEQTLYASLCNCVGVLSVQIHVCLYVYNAHTVLKHHPPGFRPLMNQLDVFMISDFLC